MFMVDGWAVRLLRVLWILALIISGFQAVDESHGFFEWLITTLIFFIGWIIVALIPLQYILLGSMKPNKLI